MKAVLSELPEFKRLQHSESDRRRLEEVPQCLTINDKRAAEEEQFGFPSSDQYRWDTVSEPENGHMRSRMVPAVKCIINNQELVETQAKTHKGKHL
ncbi:hypothetical protein GGH14_002603 [Coemansia sp. RSA 370]|nr:hypothetical protein GGH14_002603 [Coemansia sp. RSA 370]